MRKRSPDCLPDTVTSLHSNSFDTNSPVQTIETLPIHPSNRSNVCINQSINRSFVLRDECAGQSMGFGFVKYTDVDGAAAAIRAMNGMIHSDFAGIRVSVFDALYDCV